MLRSGEVRGVVIYLDRVFLVNALVDYLLLAVCAQLAAIPLQRWRCALGGFIIRSQRLSRAMQLVRISVPCTPGICGAWAKISRMRGSCAA